MNEYDFAENVRRRATKYRSVEKAMLFDLLLKNGEMSRKSIQSALKCRPNNITDYVQELMDADLVVESHSIVSGKGRPETMLKVVPDHFVALSVWVDSRNLKGSIVDLLGRQTSNAVTAIPIHADNTSFYEILVRFISDFIVGMPKHQKLIGIGISLPGAVMSQNMRWSFNSHLLYIRNLDFSRLSQRFNVPVRLYRLLDAQILSIVRQNKVIADSSILMVHWGEGIGASLYLNGNVLRSVSGDSCEIGHLKIDRTPSARKCRCGEFGCLETVASGWSLSRSLKEELGISFNDEESLGEALATAELEGVPDIDLAVSKISSVIDSIFRICFPEKVMLYGPFFRSPYIRSRFVDHLNGMVPEYVKGDFCIEFLDEDRGSMTAVGCSSEFFIGAVLECLD